MTMSEIKISLAEGPMFDTNSIQAEDCVWGSLSMWTSGTDTVGTDMEVANFVQNSLYDDETRDVQNSSVIQSNHMAHLDSSEPLVTSAAQDVFEWNKIAENELLSANVDGARDALNFALKLIEDKSADHPLLTAITFTNLGSLYCQLRSFEEALRCFEKVVACSDGCHLNALLHLKFYTAYSGLGLHESALSSAECAAALFAKQLQLGDPSAATAESLRHASSKATDPAAFNASLRGLTMAVYRQVTAMAALRRDFLPLLEQGLLLSELLHDDGLTSAIRHAYARAVRAVLGGDSSPSREVRTQDTAERSEAEFLAVANLEGAAELLDQSDHGAGSGSDDGGHGRAGRVGDSNDSDGSDSGGLGRQTTWPTEQVPGSSADTRLPSESGGALHRTRDCGMQTHIALAPLSRAPLPPLAVDSKAAPLAAGSESPRTQLYASHFGVAWRVLFAPRRPPPPPAELRNPAAGLGGVDARPRVDSDTEALPGLGARRDWDRNGSAPTHCQLVRAPYVGRDSDSLSPPADSEVTRENTAFSPPSAAAEAWRLGPKTSGPDQGSAGGGRTVSGGQQQPNGHSDVVAAGRCNEIKAVSEGESGTASASVGSTALPPASCRHGGDRHDMRLLVATRYLEVLACTCAIRIQQAVRACAARRKADALRSGVVAGVLAEAIRVVQRQARCWIARRKRRNREAESVARARCVQTNSNLFSLSCPVDTDRYCELFERLYKMGTVQCCGHELSNSQKIGLKKRGTADFAHDVLRTRASLKLQAGAAAALLSSARLSQFRMRIIKEADKAGVSLSDPSLHTIPGMQLDSKAMKGLEEEQQIPWRWLRTPLDLGLRRQARERVRSMHEEMNSWHEACAILAQASHESHPCGICDDFEVLSQRLMALGYSSEELQCWHLSVELTSHPVHATVDLLRCRLPCHLNNQGTYIRMSAGLCVCTEAKTLFKSLRAKESKGTLSKKMNSLEIAVLKRVSSHEEPVSPQPGILVQGCRSFLSGMGFTDEEVQIFMEAALKHSTLDRLSQSDFIDCFCLLRLACTGTDNNTRLCNSCVHSSNKIPLNISDRLPLGHRTCDQDELSGQHFECRQNVNDANMTRAVSTLKDAARTDILLLGMKAAKAAGSISTAWRCHASRAFFFSLLGRTASGSMQEVLVYLRLKQFCTLVDREHKTNLYRRKEASSILVHSVLCRRARKELAQLKAKSAIRVPWGLWGKGPADGFADEQAWSNWSVSRLLQRAEAASRLQCSCLRAVEYLQARAALYSRQAERRESCACSIQRIVRGHFVRIGASITSRSRLLKSEHEDCTHCAPD